jgi:hypothetical protein
VKRKILRKTQQGKWETAKVIAWLQLLRFTFAWSAMRHAIFPELNNKFDDTFITFVDEIVIQPNVFVNRLKEAGQFQLFSSRVNKNVELPVTAFVELSCMLRDTNIEKLGSNSIH